MSFSVAKRPKTAFVLDDDARASTLVCKLLGALGYETQGFTDAVPFLAKLKSRPPGVVLLDLELGRSDAVEVIRQLETIHVQSEVLLISGRDQLTLNEIQCVGIDHGLAMLPSLRKPFRLSDLKTALNSPAKSKTINSSGLQAEDAVAAPGNRVDLAQAIREGWLELWYQPKIDLKSLTCCGAEALVRARHPEFGVVSPAQLLPPAGDQLYRPLSKFVFRHALKDWPYFADAGLPLKLAVNMPISVVNIPELVGMARELLPKDRRFPGLIIEVTEDDVVRDPQQVREVAAQLKLYGIGLSIDDFGTAYSSLSRLLELPCTELKIDRSFVSGCADDEHKRTLCRAVVDLAHRFDIQVCAEGIERVDDLRCLLSLGCDTAQGFLFGKPMDRSSFVAALPHTTRKSASVIPQSPVAVGADRALKVS